MNVRGTTTTVDRVGFFFNNYPGGAAQQKQRQVELLDDLCLGGYDRDKIVAFGNHSPRQFLGRVGAWTAAYLRVRRAWASTAAEEAAASNMPPRDDNSNTEERTTRGDVLRREVTSLGPMAVKLGQTLSQRPDILPDDVCDALKQLQTSNDPFPNDDAWRVIADETGWGGAIAPGCGSNNNNNNNNNLSPDDAATPYLFRSMTRDPVAAA